MKTYCRECLRKTKATSGPCPSCGATLNPELQEDEIRPIVQALHKRTNDYRERISTGLSLFIIGLTFVIIGLIFWRLSYKLDQDNVAEIVYVLAYNSAEFFVAMFGLVAGGLSTVFGAVWAILWAFRKREVAHDVDEIRANKSLTVSRTPTIFEVWFHAISRACRRAAWKAKRKKMNEVK